MMNAKSSINNRRSRDSVWKWEQVFETTKRRGFEIILLVAVSSLVFISLGKSSLLDYDEAIYAQVAREMVANKDWLTLHFGGDPWFEKPPLYIWSTAILFKTFDTNEFWARAASAFSSVLVMLATYFLGAKIFDRWVGISSVLPLLASYEFLRQARNGTTDVMLSLFMIAALIAYVMTAENRPGAWILFWISFALGFLVKSWAAFIVLIAVGISIVWEKRVRITLSCGHFWGGLLVALILIAPWHVAMYTLYGQAFVDRYVLYDLIARSTGALEGNVGSTRYYFDRLLFDFSPWFLLLPTALTLEFQRVLGKRDATSALLSFAVCIFGIYSLFVDTKIFHYLTPIYPLCAIFMANVIVRAYRDSRSIAFHGLIFAAFVSLIIPSTKVLLLFAFLVGLCSLALVCGRYASLRKLKLHGVQNRNAPEIRTFLLHLGNRLLGCLEAITDRSSIPKWSVVIMVAFFTLIGALRSRPFYQIGESEVEQIARLAGSAEVLQEETILALALPPDYQDGIVGPTAMFYSPRPIEVAWTEEALSKLTSAGSREIIMAKRFVELLKHDYEFSGLASNSTYVYGVIQQKG